jgi:hypothetical protein
VKTRTIQDVVDALNEAFEEDPVAIRALLINIVPCNEALAGHPTIQVAPMGSGYTVGALGLLNGVLGALGLQLIASKWSNDTDERGAHKLLGFCLYQQGSSNNQSASEQLEEEI